jgi:UDP-GlcNAc3NAcA epimerase
MLSDFSRPNLFLLKWKNKINFATMKILTVIGARPQFIKAAAVSRAIAAANNLEEIIVHTGQHFDENMSKIFFDELHIPIPTYNLDINSVGHGAMTGRMLEKTEELLLKEKPDILMVYGDTNSTLAGALAASKLHIPVAHVEAGLRSFNMQMPEEVNRILTDRISNLLFCPTTDAIKNLENEGFNGFDCKIIQTGDVMYDAARYYLPRARKPEGLIPEKFILVTIHRAENTDDIQRLSNILGAMQEIARKIPVVLPLHPRTRNILGKSGLDKDLENIFIIPPVGYLQMIWLLQYSQMVMTDSGGLQKEAYFFEKPCITLRDQTEWTELTREGVNQLGGADKETIIKAFHDFRNKETVFPKELYGDGKASEKITQSIVAYLENR